MSFPAPERVPMVIDQPEQYLPGSEVEFQEYDEQRVLQAFRIAEWRVHENPDETRRCWWVIGRALLWGRNRHSSDKRFGQWVRDNGLDQRTSRQERTAAMRVVERWDEVEALLTDRQSVEIPANPERLLRRLDDEQAKLAGPKSKPEPAAAPKAKPAPVTYTVEEEDNDEDDNEMEPEGQVLEGVKVDAKPKPAPEPPATPAAPAEPDPASAAASNPTEPTPTAYQWVDMPPARRVNQAIDFFSRTPKCDPIAAAREGHDEKTAAVINRDIGKTRAWLDAFEHEWRKVQ